MTMADDGDGYVPVAQARSRRGMRLAVTRGVPGPWGEAAKAILHVKCIPHIRIAQETGEANAALVAWTGINSAPIAIWNDEPPRAGWAEILMLAERIAPEPSLIPADERDRATMFGLAHELCGEDGYGWNRRLIFFEAMRAAAEAGAGLDLAKLGRLRAKYPPGGSADRARGRLIAILGLLSARLRAQHALGRRHYVGEALSAIDIYGACFAAMIRPMAIDRCPAGPELIEAYTERDPGILAAADPLLLRHRDFIYETYLELPMRL
jgi:glutathione S-transferase